MASTLKCLKWYLLFLRILLAFVFDHVTFGLFSQEMDILIVTYIYLETSPVLMIVSKRRQGTMFGIFLQGIYILWGTPFCLHKVYVTRHVVWNILLCDVSGLLSTGGAPIRVIMTSSLHNNTKCIHEGVGDQQVLYGQ